MPRTRAPIGRTTAPTPNVATERSSEASSLSVGKNSFAIVTARNPYIKKSYQSRVFPIVATRTRRRTRAPLELASAPPGAPSPARASELTVIFPSLRLPAGRRHKAFRVLWIEEGRGRDHSFARHEEPVGRLLVSAQSLQQPALPGRAWPELGELEI